jgi:hypothetical protein
VICYCHTVIVNVTIYQPHIVIIITLKETTLRHDLLTNRLIIDDYGIVDVEINSK